MLLQCCQSYRKIITCLKASPSEGVQKKETQTGNFPISPQVRWEPFCPNPAVDRARAERMREMGSPAPSTSGWSVLQDFFFRAYFAKQASVWLSPWCLRWHRHSLPILFYFPFPPHFHRDLSLLLANPLTGKPPFLVVIEYSQWFKNKRTRVLHLTFTKNLGRK